MEDPFQISIKQLMSMCSKGKCSYYLTFLQWESRSLRKSPIITNDTHCNKIWNMCWLMIVILVSNSHECSPITSQVSIDSKNKLILYRGFVMVRYRYTRTLTTINSSHSHRRILNDCISLQLMLLSWKLIAATHFQSHIVWCCRRIMLLPLAK